MSMILRVILGVVLVCVAVALAVYGIREIRNVIRNHKNDKE